ncbi:MAG: P-loop NTPase, partial [Pirellulaceae bacterium]|nr:P-loop NTPase [Pirellulaceae bacterium]
MSSLIEQAQQRLAQLRRAGVDLPEPAANVPPAAVEARPVSPRAAEKAAEVAAAKVRLATSRRVELDMDKLAAAGIVTPNAPRSQIADQYRVIKRPLIGNAMGKGASPIANGNLIMVTSSVPGEGKSFTAINLAISIAAELDNTVMLVDADVARPSIMRMLGLPLGPGLLDLLQDETADLS